MPPSLLSSEPFTHLFTRTSQAATELFNGASLFGVRVETFNGFKLVQIKKQTHICADVMVKLKKKHFDDVRKPVSHVTSPTLSIT